jgi:DNA adenine methylase
MAGLAPWAGGKRHLARRLAARIDAVEHTCYVEPFTGMGGVFFARTRRRKVEVINDASGDVVTLFRTVQRHGEELLRFIAALPFARAEFERLLDARPCDLTDIERAGAFLLLQRGRWAGRLKARSFCAGGPHSTKARRMDAWRKRIGAMQERLSGVVIERGDFEEVLERYDGPASFFYCDPPYWGHETLYGKGVFSRGDFERLAAALDRLRGRFLMSIGDTPDVRAIFARFQVEEVATIYTGHDCRPKPVTELLISGGGR